MEEQVSRKSTPYTPQEEKELRKIAISSRTTWKPKIEAAAKEMGRGFDTVYAKVNNLANRLGNTKEVSGKDAGKDTDTESRKAKKRSSYKRKHPLNSVVRELSVGPKELRFPFKAIRIEGGEFIVEL